MGTDKQLNKEVCGQPNGWLTLTRKQGERIMCAVMPEDIESFLEDESWGDELEIRIRLEEVHGLQTRVSVLAPRAVTIKRAEIDSFLAGWQASDGITTKAEISEEILFAYTRKTLREAAEALRADAAGTPQATESVESTDDPLDLLEIRIERIVVGSGHGDDRQCDPDCVLMRLGTEFRNLRFARHAEWDRSEEESKEGDFN